MTFSGAPRSQTAPSPSDSWPADQPLAQTRLVPLAHISQSPSRRLRAALNHEHVAGLAASIQAVGLTNAITVRPLDQGFELVTGHHRLEACRSLGWILIPATVQPLSDQLAAQIAAAENTARADMTPYEEALTVSTLCGQGGLTHNAAANVLGRSNTWIRARLAIADLPEDLALAVHQRDLDIGVALELGAVGDPAHRTFLLNQARDFGATRAAAAAWVSDFRTLPQPAAGTSLPPPTPQIYSEFKAPKVRCFLCGADSPIAETTLARVHPICFAQVNDQTTPRTPQTT